jgi:hypothetical protein
MKTKKISKICQSCGKEYFDVPKRRLKYCSIECWKKIVTNRKTYICKNCGKEYVANVSRNTIYCSMDCMMAYYHSNEDINTRRINNIKKTKKGILPKQLWTEEANKNRLYKLSISKNRFMPPSPLGRKASKETREKLKVLHLGDKNPMWKGGITPINKIIRRSSEYKLWRESVFERDNYTCQMCGKRGGVIHPHHIKLFSKFINLRFDVNNGITLCKDCHKKIHKKG